MDDPAVNELVIIVPLKEGAYADALALLRERSPFEVEETEFARHRVYATKREFVFVFESPDRSATLRLHAEDPSLWEVAREWRKLTAGRPRKAQTAFAWERSDDAEGVTYAPTPGPGDSDGGDIYGP